MEGPRTSSCWWASQGGLSETSRATLQFRDAGLEAGFARGRLPRLLQNLTICWSVLLLIILLTLAMNGAWTMRPEDFSSSQHAQIAALSRTIGHTLVGLCIGMTGVFGSLCLIRTSFRPLESASAYVEFAAVVSGCIAMVLSVCGAYYYSGRILGIDSASFLDDTYLTDTSVFLLIDAFVTVSHMCIPVRFCFIWPVSLLGLLCYVVPALTVGTAEKENALWYSTTLAAPVGLALLGKRNLEQQERGFHASLMKEKRLRFQSEFQLSKANETRGAGHPSTDGSLDDAESHKESRLNSLPSTTRSGRRLMPEEGEPLTREFFRELEQVGEREQWFIRPDEIDESDVVLGEGGFGRVVMGGYQGISVAIKVPKHGRQIDLEQEAMISLCNELRTLRRLRHPNIVFLYGACLGENGTRLAIVLERVFGESLKEFAERPGGSGAAAHLGKSQILVDVSIALRYLHSCAPCIVHGDLTPRNVFVEQWAEAGLLKRIRGKLLDFGLSRAITRNFQPLGGTLRWMAPEVAMGEVSADMAPSTDVFSFGLLAFFLIAGLLPPCPTRRRDLRRFTMQGGASQDLSFPGTDSLSRGYQEVVRQCCRHDIEQRPSSKDLSLVVGHAHERLVFACADALSADAAPQPPRVPQSLGLAGGDSSAARDMDHPELQSSQSWTTSGGVPSCGQPLEAVAENNLESEGCRPAALERAGEERDPATLQL